MMKKRDNSYQATLANSAEDRKEMDDMCMALNYHTCKYSWTKSERFKMKHIRYMIYFYYLIQHWLDKHENYAIEPNQGSIINTAKTLIRCHFGRIG